MASPPPNYTSIESMRRSQSKKDDIRSMADAMLYSSSPVLGSAPLAPTSPPPYFGSTPTSATTSRTRERLRQAEKELEELRGSRREKSGGELTAADRKRRVDMLNRAKGASPQKNTKGIFKAACSTDLLFLMDTTSSMGDYIDTAKAQVRSIMDDIKEAFFDEVEVRIAVVGYKDHGDHPNIEFLDFTTSIDDVRAFVGKLQATGGADIPEDVLGGLRQAISANWKHQTRCIIHIADAPPHGSALNDLSRKSDFYPVPGSEPHHLTHAPLLKQMIALQLNYVLLRITSYTDRMVFAFLEAYSAASADCKLLEHNTYYPIACDLASNVRRSHPSNRIAGGAILLEEQELGTSYSALRHLVLRSVTSSASRSANRMTASFIGKERDKKAQVSTLASISEDNASFAQGPPLQNPARTAPGQPHSREVEEEPVQESALEREPPIWDKPAWLSQTNQFEGFSPDTVVHYAKTLNDMMALDQNIKLSTMEFVVRRRPRPFADGAMRLAFYARTAFSTNHFVVKSFKKKGEKNIADLAEDMRCQALCKAFALEFNALAGERYSIDFVVTTCLQVKTSKGLSEEYMSLEPFIEGEYVKYNSNSSYVNTEIAEDPVNQAAQAFSHFTFERSCGHFLVCDIQGVGREMTDPAIHTKDPKRFTLVDTNLNTDGFKFFFSTHECNDICRKLELQSNRAMMKSGHFEFRQRWPTIETTICCSNKLCGKIVRVDSAHKSPDFPGCHWCDVCWPQLKNTIVSWICAAPGPHHEFDLSQFYYESQGRPLPRICPTHREKDTTVLRAAVVGGSVYSRLSGITKKKSISGADW